MDTKAFEVSHDPARKLISVVHTGPMKAASFREACDVTLAAVKEHGCQRLLVDTSGCEGQLHASVVMEVTQWYLERLESGMRIAVIVREGDSEARFGETLARNRAQNLRNFIELDEALTWLAAD